MPRKSAAALAFPLRSGERLKPPPGLTAPERAIFLDIVASTRPEHFQPSDLPLLCAYARACALEARAAREPDAKALARWEKAIKAMAMLSMRLRLSPQARAPNNPSRSGPRPPAPTVSFYDRMRLEQESGDEADAS
jgi:hypothetical protein